MDESYQEFSFSGMGIRDAAISSSDSLSFQDLKKTINNLLDDCSPVEHLQKPFLRTRTLTDFLLEDKINYFLQVSSNIMETKNNFLHLYSCINKNIEDTTREIVICAQNREQNLKAQLRSIGSEKVAKWNKQLLICKEALQQLQKCDSGCFFDLRNSPSSSTSSLDLICNHPVTQKIEFVDAGDLKFEIEDFQDVLTTLQNFGRISFHSESSWRETGLHKLKEITPKFFFGSTGEEPGQFCRPWGVCSDMTGRILVCDRSNHRIQIFNECGQFLLKFGKEGSKPREFNRPSGIDVDGKCRIIVADKDNHRIQVFTYSGHYLFMFGSQGTKPGEFMYPWDVSVNKNYDIAVSDSKNHRVQLFNYNGNFITLFDAKKMGIENLRLGLKYFDSPRGVAFRPDGNLLVTDFNNHRVVLLNKKFDKISSFGCEGMYPGQFFRPQGIACDKTGKFAVSDCKNYRIQVFDVHGTSIKIFGSQGDEPGQFDCPQGICFHPNHNIIVVDFNNNRVQVF